MWHEAQGTLNYIESVWLGKPNRPARVEEAWRRMQIQTGTWESCSACQWIQLALGLLCALSDCASLGGEKALILAPPTLKRRRRPGPWGPEGLESWA